MENPEVRNIIDLIDGGKKSEALDKITDYLDAKASEVIDLYKQTVASSYFDEPVEAIATEE